MSDRDSHAANQAGARQQRKTSRAESADPDWTHGLRRLYDSVLEEPLPKNFEALLSKLDDSTPGK